MDKIIEELYSSHGLFLVVSAILGYNLLNRILTDLYKYILQKVGNNINKVRINITDRNRRLIGFFALLISSLILLFYFLSSFPYFKSPIPFMLSIGTVVVINILFFIEVNVKPLINQSTNLTETNGKLLEKMSDRIDSIEKSINICLSITGKENLIEIAKENVELRAKLKE